MNQESVAGIKDELQKFLTERQDFNNYRDNVRLALMLVMMLSFGASFIASKHYPSSSKQA
jgi:hypothetical protein